MNNEQLQDWLSDLHERLCSANRQDQQSSVIGNGCAASTSSVAEEVLPVEKWRYLLQELAPPTNILLNYFQCNFDDVRLCEPLITQLLSLYYRFGIGRCFVLQLLPSFTHFYLKALVKKWIGSAKMLEMFFLAIYNEEILAAGPGTPSMSKRTEEVRLPFLRHNSSVPGNIVPPSPELTTTASSTIKIQIQPHTETATINTKSASVGTGSGSQPRLAAAYSSLSRGLKSTVRIGPFSAFDHINAENRFTMLIRLMQSVNSLLTQMAPEVVCRSLCISLLYICRSGFSFKETDFRQRVLREEASGEVFADFSRKARISVSSVFLVESINGIAYALFNGFADVALRGLDAVHCRAQYEMLPDVLLVTNALRHALSDPKTVLSFLATGDNNRADTASSSMTAT